jgi:Family of unknown function (DUF6535)
VTLTDSSSSDGDEIDGPFLQSLWLLSLIISLTCAQMAISLQRCARPKEEITSPSYSLHEQAWMHAFFAVGGQSLDSTDFVGKLHILAHTSPLLFYVGAIIRLYAALSITSVTAVAWIVYSQDVYLCFTFMPSTIPGRPYSTPISQFARHVCAGMSYRLLCCVIPLTVFSRATREALNRSKD